MPRYFKGETWREIQLSDDAVLSREGVAAATGEGDWTTFEGIGRARWEYDKLIALALSEGFRRAPSEDAPSVAARHEELEADILANPDEEDAFLVYADWLQTRGDPRGELASVQHAMAKELVLGRHNKDGKAIADQLKRAEALLLFVQRELLFGRDLAQIENVDEQRYVVDFFDLSWHLGFIRRAALFPSLARREDNRELWPELLASPCAGFVRELALDWWDSNQLEEAALPATLNRLELMLERWWPPSHEEAALETDFGITSLEEVLGAPDRFVDDVLARLGHLFVNPQAPGLSELVLRQCPYGSRLLLPLFASPLMAQLSELDLSKGTLNDSDAAAISDSRAALGHLRRLDLRYNNFGPEARESLRDIGELVVV